MATDTAELDLSYVEAERIRQLSERSGATERRDDDIEHIDLATLDPASRAEAIVAEVLASARSIDDLIAELDIDLDRHERSEVEDAVAAAESPSATPADDHPARTHVVLLDREPALVLVPGQTYESDEPVYTPDGAVARHTYGPLVERALAPLREDVRLLTAHRARPLRRPDRQTTRWILVAAVWAAAMAAMVPLAIGLVGSSIDMRIELFPDDATPPADTAPADTAPADEPAGTLPGQVTP